MLKRGQVSVFAIVGIVLVILVALFFFLRNEYGAFVAPTVFLNEKAKPIEDNLKGCILSVSQQSLNTFGKQGGDFNPSNYLLYKGMNVKYFCTNIIGKEECLNVMPTLREMEEKLSFEIQNGVNSCVNKDLAKSGLGYDIKAGKLDTKVEFAGENVLVKADYDVEITKGDIKTTINPVALSFDAPVEELYSVAVDAVNAEARVGFFEQLLYMVSKKGKYIINLDKPYPDKIYKINKKDSEFEFWFAVEGERSNA